MESSAMVRLVGSRVPLVQANTLVLIAAHAQQQRGRAIPCSPWIDVSTIARRTGRVFDNVDSTNPSQSPRLTGDLHWCRRASGGSSACRKQHRAQHPSGDRASAGWHDHSSPERPGRRHRCVIFRFFSMHNPLAACSPYLFLLGIATLGWFPLLSPTLYPVVDN